MEDKSILGTLGPQPASPIQPAASRTRLLRACSNGHRSGRAWVYLLALAALFVVGLSGSSIVGAGVVTVTSPDGLNLRSSPSTQAQVLAVISLGSVLTLTGDATSDGWYPVTFGATAGWAYGAYLTAGQFTPDQISSAPTLVASSASPPSPAAVTAAPAPVAISSAAVPTTAAAPSSVAASAPTSATSTVKSSAPASGAGAPAVLVQVQAGGVTAAVSLQAPTLIGNAPSVTMTVNTDALNLRASPSLASNVLTAAPKGTPVQITGTPINNWLPVSLNGLAGWMDGTYLAAAAAFNNSSAATNSATGLTAAAFGNPTLGTPAGPEAGLALAVLPPTTANEFIWPVKESRRITTIFKSYHQAIDIDQFPGGGNPTFSTADGIVTFAGGDACCSYGLYVIVKHRDGFYSLYSHLSKVDVGQGQTIRQGQEVGLTGNTGNSTGPHLHFAIYYNGLPFDPLKLLPGSEVQSGA